MTSATIGSGVKSIDNSAFSSCDKLTEIVIPDACNTIGNEVFFSCSSLENVHLGNGLKSLGSRTFKGDKKLININFPNNLESMGSECFMGCSSIEGDIVLQNKLSYIGTSAFSGCDSINSITIHNSDCKIAQSNTTIPLSIAIKGHVGSTAQEYAETFGNEFIPIGTETTEIISPTCTEQGYTLHTCDDCGRTFKDNFTGPLGHTEKYKTAKPSTCTENGNKDGYVCSVCGEIISGCETIPAIGHEFDDGEIIKNATCTENGAVTYKCSVCGETKTETIEKLPHTVVTDPAVSATCTKSGLTQGSHCSVCGTIIVSQKVVKALNHKYVTKTLKEPTCTEKGIRSYTCQHCGDTYTKEISMIAHTPVTDNAVAPTCTKTGLTQGSHCSECGAVIEPQNEIKATGHNYVKEIVEPTCKDKGYTVYTCTVCGDSYKDDYVDTTDNHDYKTVVTTPATCSNTGVKTITCSICGNTYTETIEKVPHTVVTDKSVEPTCTKTGLTEGSHCSVCGEVIEPQNEIKAKGHNYVKEIVEPTCKDKGYTVYTCTACGDSYKDDYVDTTDNHDYKIVVTTPATCKTTGVKTITCSICGDTYTETIAKIPHTVEIDKAAEPTCTKSGLTEGSHCSVCGEVIEQQKVVPATGHKWNNGEITKPATCTESGIKTYTCTVCNETKTEVINAKGHTVVTDKAVQPTCTKTGLTEGSHCSICGEIIVKQEVIDKKPHTVITDKAEEPTCTKTGLSQGSHCSVCGEAIEQQKVVPATGHKWNNGEITKPATCTESGIKTYTCTVCNETKTEVINSKGHTAVIDKAVAPTCTSTGLTEGSHCFICGEIITKQEIVPKTPHNCEWLNDNGYIVKKCTVCNNELLILPFIDLVNINYNQYADYIEYTSVKNQFITGTNPPANTVFSPTRAINRAMMVTILYRMAGEPYANGKNPYTSSPFTDITNPNVYYYDSACWALKNGITTETTFKPFDDVTREQTASFLFRYATDSGTLGDSAYKNVNLANYPDYSNVHAWAVEAMQWANYNNMITGTQQGYINPQGATQRIHATKILYGFGKVCNIGNFE